MKIGIYCRISKDKGEGKDRSIENQISDGEAFAKENGYEYELFVEEDGTSGTLESTERPKLFELLNKIKNDEIEVFYCYNLSRLERDSPDKYIIYTTLKEKNAKLITTSDGELDLNSPEVMFYVNVMSAVSGYHVAQTKANVKRTLKNNVSKGRIHSAPPFGYTVDSNKIMIINNETAPIVKRIFDLKIQGNGGSKIAEILTNDGIPTPTNFVGGDKLTYRTKNTPKGSAVTVDKKGLKWNPGTINRIIKNRLYIGERIWNNEVFLAPQIIDHETFEKAQKTLITNKNNSENNTKHNYLLKGLIICGCCGTNYHGYTQGKRKIAVYKCYSNRIVNQNIKCNNKRVMQNVIENLIWERVVGSPIFVEVLKKDFDFNNDLKQQETTKKNIERIEKQIKSSKNALDELINLRIRNLIDDEQLISKKTILDNEIRNFNKKISSENNKLLSIENQLKIIDEVKLFQEKLVQFENPSFEIKRSLTLMFIDSIIINYNFEDKLTELKINLKIGTKHQNLSENLAIDLNKLKKEYQEIENLNKGGSVIHQQLFL